MFFEQQLLQVLKTVPDCSCCRSRSWPTRRGVVDRGVRADRSFGAVQESAGECRSAQKRPVKLHTVQSRLEEGVNSQEKCGIRGNAPLDHAAKELPEGRAGDRDPQQAEGLGERGDGELPPATVLRALDLWRRPNRNERHRRTAKGRRKDGERTAKGR